jgi:hypothetical protein
MKLTETVATCTADVMRWILANNHHHGYWTGPLDRRTAFCLEGNRARLRIPALIHRPGMMEADDFEKTGRMYKPTPAGRAALSQEGHGDE